MSSFDLIVDVSTLTPGGAGPTTGVIWMQAGDTAFPEPGWRDFPEVILAWWLVELRQLLSGQAKAAVLRFMDGPFSCEVSHRDSNWQLTLVDRGIPPRPSRIVTASPQVVCSKVYKAAQLVAHAVVERGLVARDSAALTVALREFRVPVLGS